MQEILQNIGLTTEESEIYLLLLDKGAQTAIQISKNTKVKRTYVYIVCKSLSTKGLLKIEKQGRTTIFSPLSPDHLLTLAEESKQKALANEKQIEEYLSSFKQKYALIETKPIVEIYEGTAGLKKIYKDTLQKDQPIYAFLQNSDISPDMRQWLREEYIKLRTENNVYAKVIIASGDKAKMYIKESKDALRESKIVPAEQFPFEVETNIYGNKVAFINYQDVNNPLGIIIENEAIASSLRAFFDLTWKNL